MNVLTWWRCCHVRVYHKLNHHVNRQVHGRHYVSMIRKMNWSQQGVSVFIYNAQHMRVSEDVTETISWLWACEVSGSLVCVTSNTVPIWLMFVTDSQRNINTDSLQGRLSWVYQGLVSCIPSPWVYLVNI